MKPRDGPKLEPRRAADFERELLTRARTWLPSWSVDEHESDFGLALMKIAARFNSEVAERLDKSGEKMAHGFLDWLGLPATAARAARMPVVMKMAETAREPAMALKRTKMQVDAAGSTVTFETETDLQVMPGQLGAVVAVDPEEDAYYLPPPGLTSLAQPEPLPTAWTLKNFAAPGAKTLQLDPGLGLAEGMLVEISGAQYRIVKAKDDLVTIDPVVPPGDGFAGGSAVSKVDNFRPFDGARNLQEHILYIGDSELLNIEAPARIEVGGLGAVPEGVEWAYWGKSDPEDPDDAEARWRELEQESVDGRLILAKPKGEVEQTLIGVTQSRWIRARTDVSTRPIDTDAIQLKINPSDLPSLALQADDPPAVDIFVNSTPSTAGNIYLFGQEPRLFDTLYVGCEEAFSKADATAWITFQLSDGAFDAMTVFDRGGGVAVLAGVDQGGGLRLFNIGSDGSLVRLNTRETPQPSPDDVPQGMGSSPSHFALKSTKFRPPVWLEGTILNVAVAADGDIWVRKEWPPSSSSFSGSFGFLGGSFSIPVAQFSGAGIWEYWGAPSGNSDDTVIGMAIIQDSGSPALVAHTQQGVYMRGSGAADTWQPLEISNIPTGNLELISGMRSEDPALPPQLFFAIRRRSNGTFALHSVSGLGADTEISGAGIEVDPTVTPFGISSAGMTVAVWSTNSPARLRAWRSDGERRAVAFDGSSIGGTILDGAGQIAGLTVYGRGAHGDDAALLAWMPFDPDLDDVLFATVIDIFPVAPKGPVAVMAGRVFLPGNRKGEVFGAALKSLNELNANAGDFVSALALARTEQPLDVGDKIVINTGTAVAKDLVDTEVAAKAFEGLFGNAGMDFYELDKPVGRNIDEDDVFIARNGSPAKQGDVGAGNGSSSVFTLEDLLSEGAVLLVNTGPSPTAPAQPVEITQIIDATLKTVRVEPELLASNGDTVRYRETVLLRGRAYPGVKLGSNNNWDAGRVVASGIYFPDLDPQRQPVIAIRKDIASPTKADFLVLGRAWDSVFPPPAQVDFVVADVSPWLQARTAKVANATLAWEYWNGTGWWMLDKVKDETNDLRVSGVVSFPVPDDIQPSEWAGKRNHWIRARIIGGSYGEAKVRVVTGPDGSQTVDRNTDDLQPPYAVTVRVAYALDKASTPAFLLTKDSGSLRNQSDANRTPGAEVEVFTPLSVALGRLDAPTGEARPTEQCVPDCECDTGTPSLSPATAGATAESSPAAPPASGAGRRAIYLGFTSKLIGQPATLLFNVNREDDFDAIGPLSVDALIRDRFSPIVSSDDTRGLGETGLVTLAFDVAPRKAELFGQALSWLRLTPRVGSTGWKPSLAGVYPNGVWARAAETMTRELLGSSDGRPFLAVALARPPLLHDTLELRVREPLGKEERRALTEEDANLVKSDVTDLPGHWVLWKQVFDPADCGPKDRVYSLDEASGDVRFGDGLHGMIPPVGADAIVAFAYERTEPIADGKLAANFVSPRTELNLVTPVESVETVIAADQSAGGVAPEAGERVLQFAPARLRHRGRAVSLRDFEDLVLQKFDEVVQARASERNGRVRLVVVTKGANPSPSRAQQRELRRTLLDIAPPALAARDALIIAGPRMRRLSISLDLRVGSLDVGGQVAGEAKRQLVAAFDPATGWPLGRTPREEDVAEALIDIANLDGIVSISLFELEGLAARPWRGSVGKDYLVLLAPEDIRIGFKVMEAAA